MYRYYYYVNTFENDRPVFIEGHVDAYNEEDAIIKLIEDGIVNPHGYEFIDLYIVDEKRDEEDDVLKVVKLLEEHGIQVKTEYGYYRHTYDVLKDIAKVMFDDKD